MGITAADMQLAAIPLSHAYGFGNLVMPLLLQGTAIVLRESFVPHQLSADARRYGARVFHGVPFMYQHFLAHPPADGWPPTLTLLVSAGARLELETVRGFHERFGREDPFVLRHERIGRHRFDASDELDEVPTVGRPLPGVTIELRPDDGVPPGHGRIHVRGPAVSSRVRRRDRGDAASSATAASSQATTGACSPTAGSCSPAGCRRSSTWRDARCSPVKSSAFCREMDGVTDARVLAATDVARGEQIAAVVAGPPV